MLIPFLPYAWASTPERLALAAAVTVSFALLARILRGVNWPGAMAGGVACLALFAGAGPGAFAALVALFAATWISTRLGYRRKQELGLAERREGRNARQVLANLAVAAGGAVVFGATGDAVWLVALVAALAEAATDTVASEVGQSRRREAWMITSGKRVAAGVDGGITLLGTAAGLAAGAAIAVVAEICGLVGRRAMWVPIAAGFLGMMVDSVLGGTIQRRGWISNQGVNFVATLVAAWMAYGIVMFGGN
ncbi:MAG: DUF92 domain-containing protein [Terriglobales bacterium]